MCDSQVHVGTPGYAVSLPLPLAGARLRFVHSKTNSYFIRAPNFPNTLNDVASADFAVGTNTATVDCHATSDANWDCYAIKDGLNRAHRTITESVTLTDADAGFMSVARVRSWLFASLERSTLASSSRYRRVFIIDLKRPCHFVINAAHHAQHRLTIISTATF
jgi:hypothetical protein